MIVYTDKAIKRIREGITTILAISSYSVNSVTNAMIAIKSIMAIDPNSTDFTTCNALIYNLSYKKLLLFLELLTCLVIYIHYPYR